MGPYRLAAYSGSHFIICLLAKMFREKGDQVIQLAFIDHSPLMSFSSLALSLPLQKSNIPDFVLNPANSITDVPFRKFYKKRAFLAMLNHTKRDVNAGFFQGAMAFWEGRSSLNETNETMVSFANTLDAYLDECIDFATQLSISKSESEQNHPVLRAAAGVEEWLCSPELGLNEFPRVEVFVATEGVVLALPEKLREEWIASGLGFKKCVPGIKIIVASTGHVTILSSRELIEGLQEGFIH